ncbi:SpoIIE family protein phosphatase [Pseudonocardia parietis]|uniref:histidine kinase n=1 Tax=Pseudonocardia parietis TaxID=570936 RepID=A0ABS4W4S4_9PSEU|nr:SpoIIE family protein phosphatase [Pseudonocardia parietis]MBP2371218.1 anti-anti-sigma factor [Pseudonocardia parietis]
MGEADERAADVVPVRTLLESTDWSVTPLGPRAGWDRELEDTIRFMLESRQPLVAWWGPELVLFYNDEFAARAGRRHPWTFARPLREGWPELDAHLADELPQLLSGERAGIYRAADRLVLSRWGVPEVTWWNYSATPVRGPASRVLGLLTLVTEVTESVVGARRMSVLAGLGEVARDAPSLDVAVERLNAVLDDSVEDIGCAAVTTCGPDPRSLITVRVDGPPANWLPIDPGPDAGPVVEFVTAEPAPDDGDGAGLPVTDLARGVMHTPDGVACIAVVIGAPPLLPIDAAHRSFLRLVVDHIGTVLTTAVIRDRERDHRDDLSTVEQARADYYAGLGDEFRDPLSLVLGSLERLRAHTDGAVRGQAELAHRNAERILKLVDGLLDVSALQSGKHEGLFAATELGATTAEIVAAFAPVLERAGLALDVSCPPPGRPAWVDRDAWEKVVLNLLSNAVKYTTDGGVTVELTQEGEQVVLQVADTGVGIPDDEIDSLFDRFRRPGRPRGRTAEGSGLGLPLIRQLVRLHGGSIGVASEPGRGSVFTVRIPLGFAHLPGDRLVRSPVGTRTTPRLAGPYVAEALRWLPDPPDEAEAAVGRPCPANRGRSLDGSVVDGLDIVNPDRVLVVDDDREMRGYLRDLLSEHWTVQVVADGAAALDAARTDPPDLVVADAALPASGGIELLRALRSDPRTVGVPVVLLSSRAGEEAALEGFAAGADDYLVRPFSARELLARVTNHLQLGRVRRAAELQFRAMADSTPALIWVDDPGGHRLFVNRGWLDFTGVEDPSPELGLDWRRRIHPDDRERYRSVTSAAARAHAPFEVEYRLLDRAGRYRWVLDRGAPVSDGERSAGYVGGCLDIDVQHREQRRHRIYSEVAESLESEITRTGRTDQLVRAVVDERLADIALVHDAEPEENAGTLAVAAERTALEPSLWRLSPLAPIDDRIRQPEIVGPDRLDDVLARLPALQRRAWERLRIRSAMVVPLPARGRTSAVLTTVRTEPGEPYTADDLDMLSEIGRRAGLAVDNARLLEQERSSAQRLGLLHRATAKMSAAATAGEVATIAADHIVGLLDADFAGLWEIRGEWLQALTGHGWDEDLWQRAGRIPVDAPMVFADVIADREPRWYGSAQQWAARYPAQLGIAPDRAQATGYLPLVAGNRTLGVLSVSMLSERRLSEGDKEAALAIAELAAQALDRASMLDAETDARRLAERLGAVATGLARATDLESVAEVVVEHGRSSIGAEAVAVLVVGENGQLTLLREVGWPEDGPPMRTPGRSHPLRRAVIDGEPIWNAQDFSEVRRYPVHTAVPLLVAARPIGVIGFRFADEPTFSPEQQSFVRTLANQCAQAIVRAQLHQAEHEVAVTLQRSLLPQKLPDIERLSLATRYRPGTQGTEAGGDWFDVLDLDDGTVALVVGDVVGRGPGAAAVMGQLRSAVAANLVNGQSPAGALEQLDQYALRVRGATASTVAIATIDIASGEMRYSSAGHPPPLVAGTDGVRTLSDGRGVPLGISGRPPFSEATARMEPGETILLCSDGLFERRDEVIDDGLARLSDAFGDLAGAQPRDMADTLLNRMSDGLSVPDDTVVVVARLMPAPLRIAIEADPKRLAPLRRAVGGWADLCGMGQDAANDLQLTVGEAVTNAIEHAYEGAAADDRAGVDLELALSADGSVVARVSDGGRWRPPPADPGYRGRGIALIRELAHDVHIAPSETGTTVRFRLPATPVDVGTPGAGPPVEFVAGEVEPDRNGATSPAGSSSGEDDARPAAARLRVTPDTHGVRLAIVGDLDHDGVAAIRAPLMEHAARGLPVTLNLAADAFVSSAGIALLSEAARRMAADGVPLTLVAPGGSQARRSLVLSGLDTVIGMSDKD